MLYCYNKGCGKEFSENENCQESCQHHPGAPVFHDAYKGWSCCKKRSTDFTEFLNIPGCSKGFHNPEKPKLPEKKVEPTPDISEVITDGLPKLMKQKDPDTVLERPSDGTPSIKLNFNISQSLKTALQKLKEKLKQNSGEQDDNDDSIKVGAPCKHGGCEMKFLGEDRTHGECTYHPGYPVFHEGYKFWTCCNKRTSDFNEFLKQSGCAVGTCVWMKPSEIAEKKSVCRYDWHQTSKNVIISIYAKCCEPEKCCVEANQTSMKASVAFNGGVNVFDLEVNLNGVIVPEKSNVEYLGTKCEIKLIKRDQFSWPKLEFVAPSS